MKRSYLKRSAMKRTKRNTGPDAATVEVVLERDAHKCRWCGFGISGERGRDWSLQHRRPRRMGGDPRPDTNSPANLVTVHGSGTTGCHGHIETHRAEAIHHGFLLYADDVPAERPILVDGESRWLYLTDDGQESDLPPGEEVTGWPDDEEIA